jgi:hypothetical protein
LSSKRARLHRKRKQNQNPIRKFNFDIVRRITAVKDKNQPEIDKSTADIKESMTTFRDVIFNGITQQFPQRFTV